MSIQSVRSPMLLGSNWSSSGSTLPDADLAMAGKIETLPRCSAGPAAAGALVSGWHPTGVANSVSDLAWCLDDRVRTNILAAQAVPSGVGMTSMATASYPETSGQLCMPSPHFSDNLEMVTRPNTSKYNTVCGLQPLYS